MTTPGPESAQWLMQPGWLPRLRAGIGIAIAATAVLALVLAYPWRMPWVLIVLAWLLLGVFLVWASRYERSGTSLEPDALTVVEGQRPRRLTRSDILDLRAHPAEEPWRLEAVLRDGQVVPLLGVPPAELERLKGWHVGA